MEKAFVFYIFLVSTIVVSQLEETYFKDELIRDGLMFPRSVSAYIGEDVVLKLKNSVVNQFRCTYRRPRTEVDVEVPDSMRPSGWNENECGIRLHNITKEDEGFWRLISVRDSEFMQSVAYIAVDDIKPAYDPNVQQTYSPLAKFTPENAEYCYVYRTDITNKNYNYEFPHHGECMIPETNLDPEANGIWNVKVGVNKQTDEMEFQINVDSKIQKLITSTQRTSDSSIILQCNLENKRDDIEINFCRFSRTSDDYGVHLEEGMGNAKYSYYGEGFVKGNCGLQIHNPSSEDRSIWKCFLGLTHQNSVKSTIGAIVDISDVPTRLTELKTSKTNSLVNETINILCENNIAIEFCWFTHPNGSKISVTDQILEAEDRDYWYYGNGFLLGHCGLTFRHANITDTGSWKCNVGIYNTPQMQISQEFDVRVTESNLVAQSQVLSVGKGDNLLIECVSMPLNTPLDYCRFVMPNGDGFSINEQITSDKALQGIYFFNPNYKLENGYCSLVVKEVTTLHNGTWTCAGKLLGWMGESSDDVAVRIINTGLSVASVIGLSFGLSAVLTSVLGILLYRRYKRRNSQEEMPLAAIPPISTES